MPAATLDPTKKYLSASHPYSLKWGGVEIGFGAGKGYGVPYDSISVSEVGGNGASTINFTILDAKRALSLPALGRIQLIDHTVTLAGEMVFAGFAQGRRTIGGGAGPTGYAVEVKGTDYGYLLDTCYVPKLSYKAGYSDQALVQGVVAHSARHYDIVTHTAFCTSTNASMPAMDFGNMTLRAAIESIQAAAGANRKYYVDFLGRLHYFQGPTESAMGAAPAAITETPGGTNASGLLIEYDESQIVNAVYVVGANPAGTGWVKDEVSIKAYGLRQGSFDAPTCKSAAQLASTGAHFLALHKDPIVRGQFTLTGGPTTGWRVGQTLTLTSSTLGITAATYPIVQIDTIFVSGSGVRERTVYFGDLPASGRRRPNPRPVGSVGPSGGNALAAANPAARTAGHSGAPADATRL